MKIGGLSLRLAVWVGVLGLLQAGAVLAFSYFTLDDELENQQRAVLQDKAEHAGRLVSTKDDGQDLLASAAQFTELVNGHSELHLMLARAGSDEAWMTLGAMAPESLLRLRGDTWPSDSVLEWRTQAGDRPMLSLTKVAKTQNGESFDVVLSGDRSNDRRLLNGLLITSLSAAPFALAFVGICAVAIVKIGLRPLKRFSGATAHISAQSLSARIDPHGFPAELRNLADAFNAMLDRLDEGVKRLSEFSSDLAHELRTPLATLLGRTQVALSQPRSNEDLVEVLAGNSEEIQRLSRLIADMLFLAQADDAKATLDRVRLELGEEARKLVEFMELLAHDRNMTILVSGEAAVFADRQQVRRVITNLLSNALRHGTPGSSVRVSAYADSERGCIDVINDGEAISPEHLARLFDRFYRIDTSRARESGGSGLGLAIVRAIMTLHGGTVHVESSSQAGTIFTLCFPNVVEGSLPTPTL